MLKEKELREKSVKEFVDMFENHQLHSCQLTK